MVTRILLILTIAGMVVIGAGGCSSSHHSGGALAPTGTPTPRSSSTPALPGALRVGDIAPDFALDTLDGTSIVHLSDYSGRPILLHFWAITCAPCVKEQPVVQRFYAQQQAAGKRLIVLGVDIDQVDEFVNVATLQQSLGLTYPILVDDHFQARTSYQITDVPEAYFLDRQHVIRSVVPGPLDETVLRKEASNVEG
jgi:cytochrome c biogenesis protein CcmG, thiol:disulfide interchange protein DsbE